MTTITANIPDQLEAKVRKFIEELGGEIISESRPSKKEAVLMEMEQAFLEAKDIRDGIKQGCTLQDLLSGK